MLKQADATRVHADKRAGSDEAAAAALDRSPAAMQRGMPGGREYSSLAGARTRAGRWQQAWKLILDDNPFPAVHGRACYHPCQSKCNRGELDSAVGIHAVERLVGDVARKEKWQSSRGEPTGRRVLIVGAGPAGLSCAYHLARLGHAVEVREATEEPGGMMRWGIPAYRLPREVVHEEIARITAMGVTITCGRKVEDVLAEKTKGGFDAVFLVGTPSLQSSRHPGSRWSPADRRADLARGRGARARASARPRGRGDRRRQYRDGRRPSREATRRGRGGADLPL